MRHALTFLAVAGLLALGVGYLGQWFAPGDSLAVLRPQILGLAPLVLIALGRNGGRRGALVATIVVLAAAGQTVWAVRGVQDEVSGDYGIYQKNLLWRAADRTELIADILAADVDFVVLEEVSPENRYVLEALAAQFPYRSTCPDRDIGGIAILSRFPLEPVRNRCWERPPLALARAILPDGRKLLIAGVHFDWPFPFRQTRQLRHVLDRLSGLEGPIIVAGDFNMVPWASAVRRVAQAADAQRLGGYATTYPKFGWVLPLPIDQVMIPRGAKGTVEVRPLFGSDHYGLLARFDY
jgi:endonuclease/exonuclease/phosphatase (EEP) superfamily protein YafD